MFVEGDAFFFRDSLVEGFADAVMHEEDVFLAGDISVEELVLDAVLRFVKVCAGPRQAGQAA